MRPEDYPEIFKIKRQNIALIMANAVTTEKIAKLFRVSTRSIRRRMKETRDLGIFHPWIRVGRQAYWNTENDVLRRWLEDLEEAKEKLKKK